MPHTLARDSAPSHAQCTRYTRPLVVVARKGGAPGAADGVAHVRAVEQRKDTRTLDDTTTASCQGPWCHWATHHATATATHHVTSHHHPGRSNMETERTREARIEEKNELQGLNDRLEAYGA